METPDKQESRIILAIWNRKDQDPEIVPLSNHSKTVNTDCRFESQTPVFGRKRRDSQILLAGNAMKITARATACITSQRRSAGLSPPFSIALESIFLGDFHVCS
ncbi:hypothetical protein TNCV_1098101 [Trichonephila clavipes]|nr:hypothetical protein TNCV_1098101 [Trichonephila clavipes]